MNSRLKGLRNQRKSRDWILANPQKYGCTYKSRIEIVRGGLGNRDFFGFEYSTSKLAGFDLITMPDIIATQYVYLIQVKTNKKPHT